MSESWAARTYRWGWTILWVALSAVGGLLDVCAYGWPATVAVACVLAAAGAGWHLNRVKPARQDLASVMGVAAMVGVSTAGWVSILGPAALLLPLVAGVSRPGTGRYLTSLPRARALWSHFRPEPGRLALDSTSEPALPAVSTSPGAVAGPSGVPDPGQPRPPEPPTPVTCLTDAELCWAWRASFRTLEVLLDSSDTARQAQLITRRQQYLDELEHRHPRGFRQWLASGARPAADPSRYIRPA